MQRQVKLVKDGKLAGYQCTAYRDQQGKTFQLWDKYEHRDLAATEGFMEAHIWQDPPSDPHPNPAFSGTYGFPVKVRHFLISTPPPPRLP